MVPARVTKHVGGPSTVTFLGLILSATAALLEWPSGIVFLGAVISAAGALWASIRQGQSEREVGEKTEEIAQLNRQIAASVTGGDSFCYLALTLGDGTTSGVLMVVVQQGDYPLYDVSMRIVDLEKFDLISDNLTLEMMAQAETHVDVGNLGC